MDERGRERERTGRESEIIERIGEECRAEPGTVAKHPSVLQ